MRRRKKGDMEKLPFHNSLSPMMTSFSVAPMTAPIQSYGDLRRRCPVAVGMRAQKEREGEYFHGSILTVIFLY